MIYILLYEWNICYILFLRIERQTQTTTMKDNNRKKYNTIIINHENWLSKCLTWSKEKQYRGVCVVCVCD